MRLTPEELYTIFVNLFVFISNFAIYYTFNRKSLNNILEIEADQR